MTNLAATLRRFHHEESGQDLIEYALIAALIALAAVVGMGTLANGLNSSFSNISNRLGAAMNS